MRDNSTQTILDYLRESRPDYLDAAFIAELAQDFPLVDILEEIKTFRWHYDNAPLARVKNVSTGV